MEQSNKNITNPDTLTSERERNLAKENGETQLANINDENIQDYDDQQPSEKDIVQPEDISNAPTEKCLENVGQLQEKLRKDTEYCLNVLKRVISVVKYLAIRGLSIRGTEEICGSPHDGNVMGALELLSVFDPFIRS
ncbi:uncharacterized protein TNCV_1657321 [Trichonephila clavipes]|nr:uncharacterized protein TNCV_1657321 [Trichonephila clavipes]